ncbi:MAG: hypothetical protein K9N52_00580 [Verrucomicrobia bacterium]|nr:hypothetical protein [Verrucomicrobiota bacterium]
MNNCRQDGIGGTRAAYRGAGRPFYYRLYALVITIIALMCLTALRASSAENTVLQDICVTGSDSTLTLSNSKLTVRVNTVTGDWLALTSKSSGNNLISTGAGVEPLDFNIDDKWMVAEHGRRLLSCEYKIAEDRRFVELRMVFGVKADEDAGGDAFEYLLSSVFALRPDKSMLERSATVTRMSKSGVDSAGAVKFKGFVFRYPGLKTGSADDCLVTVPGPFFPNTFIKPRASYMDVAERSVGLHGAPDAGFGIVVIENRNAGESIGTWMNTAGEVTYHTRLERGGGGLLSVSQLERRYVYLRTGECVGSDSSLLHVKSGAAGDVLAEHRTMAESEMPLAETPEWARQMVILEVYLPYFKNGFRGVTEKLPFYKKIGFNTVYLMPHWKGGYSPIDLFKVNEDFGTKEELKKLVDTAHTLGMRVLFDMVIHGFNEKSNVPDEHPGMFVENENGALARHPTWGSITTDWADPEYRRYMCDLVKHDVLTYGIDGYRVDAATYKGTAWERGLPYPVYRQGSAAPGLMREMLRTLREVNPDAVLLSEVFGPVYYSVCNLAHDNQTEAVQFLIEQMDAGKVTARDYKLHVANVFAALPDDANRVFYARNHDTSWFYHFNGYTPRFLAFEAVHAFFAIPEIFAGDTNHKPNPDDDPAVYDYYKRLFDIRREYPVLATGRSALAKVESSNPMVFSGMRMNEASRALVLISFSADPESARISVKDEHIGDAESDWTFIDPISCKELGERVVVRDTSEIDIQLQPFQVVLGIRKTRECGMRNDE